MAAAGSESVLTGFMQVAQAAVETLRAVDQALNVPRNRFGKLVPTGQSGEALRLLALRYKVGGADDVADQACKVIAATLRQLEER